MIRDWLVPKFFRLIEENLTYSIFPTEYRGFFISTLDRCINDLEKALAFMDLEKSAELLQNRNYQPIWAVVLMQYALQRSTELRLSLYLYTPQ
jgi:hypothetical protein